MRTSADRQDLLGSLLLCVALLGACGKNNVAPVPGPDPGPIGQNFIHNPSFEANGYASLAGWTTDPLTAFPVEDPPVGGGNWALQLQSGANAAIVSTGFTGLAGHAVYQLSAQIKNLNGQDAGVIALVQRRNGSSISSKSAHASSTTWGAISVSDTMDVQATDSLRVQLSTRNDSPGILFTACFDLVELKRIQ